MTVAPSMSPWLNSAQMSATAVNQAASSGPSPFAARATAAANAAAAEVATGWPWVTDVDRAASYAARRGSPAHMRPNAAHLAAPEVPAEPVAAADHQGRPARMAAWARRTAWPRVSMVVAASRAPKRSGWDSAPARMLSAVMSVSWVSEPAFGFGMTWPVLGPRLAIIQLRGRSSSGSPRASPTTAPMRAPLERSFGAGCRSGLPTGGLPIRPLTAFAASGPNRAWMFCVASM